jgi:hypothetical protein
MEKGAFGAAIAAIFWATGFRSKVPAAKPAI